MIIQCKENTSSLLFQFPFILEENLSFYEHVLSPTFSYLKEATNDILGTIYHQMSAALVERMLSCDAKRDNQDEDHEWVETFYEFCICKEGTI